MPLPDTLFGQQRRIAQANAPVTRLRPELNKAAWQRSLQTAGGSRAPLQTMQQTVRPAAPTPPLLQRNSSGYYAGQPGAPGEPFNGAFVMAALRNIGQGVQRASATAREFGIGQGVSPATGTPAARAFELGGALPTQPAQPFFRRPKWWPR